MRWLILLCATRVLAQDAQLDALRKTLLPMRGREATAEGRGFPELTAAKHQLRDWIESRLATFRDGGNVEQFSGQLNQELKDSGLVAPEDSDDQDFTGWVFGVGLDQSAHGIIVETSIGIDCGVDESAYIYSRGGDVWQRIWETEQNDYRREHYFPQYLDVKTSHDLVVTAGVNPACISAWQTAYFRVWKRLGDEFRLAVDRRESIYLGDREMRMAVNDGSVLIEYDTHDLSPSDHHRRAVLHWEIDSSGKPQRVDPIALSPQTFVSEWFSRPWDDMQPWTENGARLRERHDRQPKWNGYGSVLHCASQPDLWQVASAREDANDIYFLVRWKPPYRFAMADIRDTPDPRCIEPDPAADRNATLFP